MSSSEEETFDVSEDEKAFLKKMRTMSIKPDASGEAMARMARAMVKHKAPKEEEDDYEPTKTGGGFKFPKFHPFSGDEGVKGEVSYETFKSEVIAVLVSETLSFTDEQVMFGIRNAVRGKASDKVRRLGIGATTDLVLQKLDSDYGTVENKESALKNFYTCEQKHGESVENYATRLEDLFFKAVELGAFRMNETNLLKEMLHSGLRKDLKQISVYQKDKIKDYDNFKKELRRMETEMADEPDSDSKKPCKPAVSTDKKEDSEVTRLLRQLNQRIDKLEQGKKEQNSGDDPQQWYGYGGRGQGRGSWRGARGRGDYSDRGAYGRDDYCRRCSYIRGDGRGRGGYRPRRPFGSGTFAPTCYVCGHKGHTQFNCPTILAQLTCLHCKEKGHLKKDCPNL